MRRSQNTEHAKVACSLTNGRPGFDYQKSLNTKISLNIFFVFVLIEQRHEKKVYTKKNRLNINIS